MTIQECYQQMGGDYDGVLQRLGNEERVRKFLLKISSDKTFDSLQAAMERGDPTEIFRAAHSLKGVGMNLGLTSLASTAAALSESLRSGQMKDDASALFEAVRESYQRTLEAIRLLFADELGAN